MQYDCRPQFAKLNTSRISIPARTSPTTSSGKSASSNKPEAEAWLLWMASPAQLDADDFSHSALFLVIDTAPRHEKGLENRKRPLFCFRFATDRISALIGSYKYIGKEANHFRLIAAFSN